MDKPLINRVAQSSLKTINLEDFFPEKPIVEFDLKDFLFKGLILVEKEFRTSLKEYDWSALKEKNLIVYCSTDAIIPVWAYMLVAANASKHTPNVFIGNRDAFLQDHYHRVLGSLDFSEYDEQRVVIKGCSNRPVPPAAYAYLTQKLRAHAQSIMYGEPCSTVPIYKRPRKLTVKK